MNPQPAGVRELVPAFQVPLSHTVEEANLIAPLLTGVQTGTRRAVKNMKGVESKRRTMVKGLNKMNKRTPLISAIG